MDENGRALPGTNSGIPLMSMASFNRMDVFSNGSISAGAGAQQGGAQETENGVTRPTKRVKTETGEDDTTTGADASGALAARALSEGVASAASELGSAVEEGHLKEGGSQATLALRRILDRHDEMGKLLLQPPGQDSGAASDTDLRAAWEAREASLGRLMKGLRGAVEEIRGVLDRQEEGRASLSLEPVASGKDFGKAVVSYAHKICYTSFAPASENQANFRPPAPQEWQLMQGKLHKHAAEVRRREAEEQARAAAVAVNSKGEAPTGSGGPQQPSAAAAEGAAGAGGAPGAAAREMPEDIPQMPPGWKPGDPIPGLDAPAAPTRQPSGLPGTVEATVTAMPSAPPKSAPLDLGLLLDPSDMPMDEDEYVSESESDSDSDEE